MSSNISARLNSELLDKKFAQWKADPQSVEPTWSAFFEGFELGMAQLKQQQHPQAARAGGEGAPVTNISSQELAFRARIVSLVYAFRTIGHTGAWTDPLSSGPPVQERLELAEFGFTEADLEQFVETQFFEGAKSMPLGEMLDRLRRIYCSSIGFEFMHIHRNEVRNWIRERIEKRIDEPARSVDAKKRVLRWLTEAETFERFLHQKYVGQKRFSLEGGESLMVSLNSIAEASAETGIEEIVMGMAHRGRLNVLANFLQKSAKMLLYEFSENYVPDLVAGDGDVKYHLGYESRRRTEAGPELALYLAANPSHLEAVDAVVEGKARARQRIIGDNIERKRVLPILVHGDAAFAGQGVVAEVLNLSQLPGYRTGGTIHIIVNNQIGFTTMPADARSSDYATDVAKMIEAPIFHVNGDDPMEVEYVSQLALEFRQAFARDVIIDIVCYRRHGHNEGDEPMFTQPSQTLAIQNHPSTRKVFADKLVAAGDLIAAEPEAFIAECEERLQGELDGLKALEESGDARSVFAGSSATFQPDFSFDPTPTGLTPELLKEIGTKIADFPETFNINRKVKRAVLDKRRKAAEEGGPFDWANGEALAFGSLLVEGNPVRLSGQDCRRGTFSQRHAVLYDSETRERHVPLMNLRPDQARFCAYNSLLSEAAVLGFDYGYSLMEPSMLILWEAQFGDFSNGAQVIIDQFISSAESKWSQPSGIVLLLPHGYEGQGPEHSSARLERFLQLCAEKNMQVCNITTPAQYFHALRRQMRREFRKPLVIMTPKSLLRHPDAVSHADEFAEGTYFNDILDDPQLVDKPNRVTRLIFCSGKVFYDLLEYRNSHKLRNVAIIRIEQLYPFNEELLKQIVSRYPRSHKKWVWCQEEPLNMGAWSYIWSRLEKISKNRVRYAGRDRSSSPAVGSKAMHVREQRQLIEQAFEV
ncbi:MAG: 2-oxoglutarate dehydrogenase E1 component [Verrucomicrobiales bacterium]|jgi:2-oxoglutarate dehydrogenase E1 component